MTDSLSSERRSKGLFIVVVDSVNNQVVITSERQARDAAQLRRISQEKIYGFDRLLRNVLYCVPGILLYALEAC